MPINFRNLTFWSLLPKLSFSHNSAVWDLSYKQITKQKSCFTLSNCVRIHAPTPIVKIHQYQQSINLGKVNKKEKSSTYPFLLSLPQFFPLLLLLGKLHGVHGGGVVVAGHGDAGLRQCSGLEGGHLGRHCYLGCDLGARGQKGRYVEHCVGCHGRRCRYGLA